MQTATHGAGCRRRGPAAALGLLLAACAQAGASIEGVVVDGAGRPLAGVLVTHTRPEGQAGPAATSVFSDAMGQFSLPGGFPPPAGVPPLTVRAPGWRLDRVDSVAAAGSGGDGRWQLVLAREGNFAASAPASAWLARIGDRRQRSQFVMDCIDCHQVPSPEVRAFAASIAGGEAADPVQARREAWQSMVGYMNALSAWEFSRGSGHEASLPQAHAAYSVNEEHGVVELLATTFADGLQSLPAWDWGAPLMATGNTVIREYAIDPPNAVREVLLLGEPPRLWVADVASNDMIAVDPESGAQEKHPVPVDVLMAPHSLHRGADDSLWVTPLFNGVVARRDAASGQWQTWKLAAADGTVPGIHDLSFGHGHELLTDAQGRIWFSDIGNTGVGYFDPRDGRTEVFPAPVVENRPGWPMLYGLIMTADRSEVWYSQLANGVIGGFDLATREYIGPFLLDDPNAGPRRITIDDRDVMYVALYGSGQLAEFDIPSRRMLALHDLPDTASAPYSATWDPRRRVVWVVTANGDAIYRFDPQGKTFAVLPMPRQQAFMRMLDVHPRTGVLVGSYANIVVNVQGPRMAFIIDPGDDAYARGATE